MGSSSKFHFIIAGMDTTDENVINGDIFYQRSLTETGPEAIQCMYMALNYYLVVASTSDQCYLYVYSQIYSLMKSLGVPAVRIGSAKFTISDMAFYAIVDRLY